MQPIEMISFPEINCTRQTTESKSKSETLYYLQNSTRFVPLPVSPLYKNRTVLRPFWRRTAALWRIQCCNRMFARPLPQPPGAASSRVSSKFCHQKKTYFNSSIKSRRHHKCSCVKSRVVDNSLFSSALFCLLSVKIWSPIGCALQKMMTPCLVLTITMVKHHHDC